MKGLSRLLRVLPHGLSVLDATDVRYYNKFSWHPYLGAVVTFGLYGRVVERVDAGRGSG
jgi:hypothetical protein